MDEQMAIVSSYLQLPAVRRGRILDQDMKGSVRVFCRFRPLAKREEDLGDIPVLHKAERELG